MLGIKPNRITNSDDNIKTPVQNEINLPPIEKPEEIEEFEEPKGNYSIPGENSNDMFSTLTEDENINKCSEPKKINKLFRTKAVYGEQTKSESFFSKINPLYLAMAAGTLVKIFW